MKLVDFSTKKRIYFDRVTRSCRNNRHSCRYAFASLGKAKAKGKQAVCINNLKQWGLVWQFYCDENDGKFSQGIGTSNMNGGWWRGEWVAALEKFWRKQDILLCPEAKLARSDNGPSYKLKPVDKYKRDSWTLLVVLMPLLSTGHFSTTHTYAFKLRKQ